MGARLVQETRILLVDDEPDFRDILAYSFKKMGYQVLTASNGREAFDLIQKNPVDVIISDIRMPGGDGVELLDRAKALLPETPVFLLVTGFADLTVEEAHHKGAEALICKPFDRKMIQGIISRLLTPTGEKWTRDLDQVDVELKVQLQFKGLCAAADAKAISLGRGGMFVALNQGKFPNVNDTVAFKLGFDGTGPALVGSGSVRWVRIKGLGPLLAGCGIEFTYLADRERARIVAFIETMKPKAYIPNQ